MISRKRTFFLGIFIFIIPFLGLPNSWKTLLTVASGVFLIVLSITIVLPKRHARARGKREKATPVFVESMPVFSRDNLIDKSNEITQPDIE